MSERFNKFNNSRTEILKTQGFDISGPEETLSNQEMFDESVKNSTEEIGEGVRFEQKHIVLDKDGSHTNCYRIAFQEDDPAVSPDIETRSYPFHLKRLLVNDPDTLCAINGGFFLLVDDDFEVPPAELAFGTVIRNGVVRSIQSHDRPVLWTDESARLKVTEVRSHGLLTLGGTTYSWSGNNCSSLRETEIRLFSTDSCIVEHVTDERTGRTRKLNQAKSHTPSSMDVVDIVCEIAEDRFCVTKINEGGGTAIIDGGLVLQGGKSRFSHVKIDDVAELRYHDFDIARVSQAITIGPSIFDFEHEIDHSINHDKSLGEIPPFTERRMARSVIYKTKEDQICFELFDGAPKTKLFQGVSPHEVYTLLTTRSYDIEWGYFLDPGQSARLAVRHRDGNITGHGNQHYLHWPKAPNQPFVWAGEHGRATPSAITLKRKFK